MANKIVLLKRSLIVLAVIVILFTVLVALRPNTYHVERSAKIEAPPAKAFALVNDFHKWELWSPWEKLDPNMKRTFEGPAAGEGAIYAWDGDGKVGAGKMTILENQADKRVRIKLEFFRPFEDSCITEFNYKPDGSQTDVTWTMSGNHNTFSKIMCLFMSMDKMIGGDFEKGLAQMKAELEKPSGATDGQSVEAAQTKSTE